MKKRGRFAPGGLVLFLHSSFGLHHLKDARVTTADTEQTTVAAFRPWRGS